MNNDKSSGISRRSFIKGTAAGVVGIAGASVLGSCSADKKAADLRFRRGQSGCKIL